MPISRWTPGIRCSASLYAWSYCDWAQALLSDLLLTSFSLAVGACSWFAVPHLPTLFLSVCFERAVLCLARKALLPTPQLHPKKQLKGTQCTFFLGSGTASLLFPMYELQVLLQVLFTGHLSSFSTFSPLLLISEGSPSLQDSWFSKSNTLVISDSLPLTSFTNWIQHFRCSLVNIFFFILRNLRSVWGKNAKFLKS